MNTNQELKHYAYPKIGQFRNIVKTVSLQAAYVGKDENGEPIYNNSLPKPKIIFQGTVKIHGTNMGIVIDRVQDVIYYQSRENIITPIKDNAGCATYLCSIEEDLLKLFAPVQGDIIVIYGEWAGQSIQKGVAISNVPKSMFIFDIKVDGEYMDSWEVAGYSNPDLRVYNIWDFPNYEVEIDFNNPDLVQNELVRITEEVEKECPVAKALGFSGTGEGIVWRGAGHYFKVKGQEHSISNVKTLASVDIEKVKGIAEFVENTVTHNRCQQMLDKLRETHQEIDQKLTGDFIKLVREDILKEELDTLVGNGLEVKMLNGPLSIKAKNWFMQNM